MVGVARIELATPAMSMRWVAVILSFEISLMANRLGAIARNLPNSLTVEFPFRFRSILDGCLKPPDS